MTTLGKVWKSWVSIDFNQVEVIRCLMECIRIEVLRKIIDLGINVIFSKV